MFPISFGKVFKPPTDYQPPDAQALANNTEYPNLNCTDYAVRPINRQLRHHQAWECIASNGDNNIIIATNKLNGREWNSTIWGYEQIDDLSQEQAVFKLQCDSLTTCMKYATPTTIVVAHQCGKLKIWSTYAQVRDEKNPYCLFLLGGKTEHRYPIRSLEIMQANIYKYITGDKNGTLKVWDTSQADLTSYLTFDFAHCDVITALTSSAKEESIFATCSTDKTILLWDVRNTRPAKGLYDDHVCGFKDLTWCPTDTQENLLLAGDQCGYVHTVDKRVPKKMLNSMQYTNKPIRKLLPNGSKLAILADSNVLKVIDLKEQTVIYDNQEAESFLRDGLWHTENQLLVVGFDGKLYKHQV